MESFDMNRKHHPKHKRHLRRQPDAYEIYELEHMPHELTKAPSDRVGPQPRHIFVSDDYYETEIEAKPYWRPSEGANEVILRPNYYESGRNVQHSMPRGFEEDCEGDVDCMAHKFIELEHEKFEQSKWMSMKK